MEIKPPALLPAFIQRFRGGVLRTATEKWTDLLLLVVAALYAIVGKHANFWDAITPLVWIACAILGFHVIRATVQVWQDDQLSSASSAILGPDNKPATILPRSYFTEKLVATLVVSVTLLAIPAYTVEHMAAVETAPIPAAPAPSRPLDLAIYIDCNMEGLPIVIRPMSSIQVVPVNEAYMRSNHWGSEEIRNESSKPMKWPDAKKMESARRQHDPGVFGYDCTITDLGSVDVLDLALPMRFWFGQKGGNQNAVPFAPIISPLGAGANHAQSIHFVNDCPTLATGIFPDSVTLQVIGETKRRTVPLHFPHRNPVEPIMMWFPAKVQFVGATQYK
jgi:hypothetical protein